VFATGEGVYQRVDGSSVRNVIGEATNTSAVDTTASQALVLSVINGTASGSYETKLFRALVEIL
jgi:hypothetical protein